MTKGQRCLDARHALDEGLSILQVAVVASIVPLLVRLDLRNLQRYLEPRRSKDDDPSLRDGKIAIVGTRVNKVIRGGRPIVRPGCLTRGITSYYFLRREGLNVSLCFGIAPKCRVGVIGHCWLILDDAEVLESLDPTSRYIKVARLSSRGVTATTALG